MTESRQSSVLYVLWHTGGNGDHEHAGPVTAIGVFQTLDEAKAEQERQRGYGPLHIACQGWGRLDSSMELVVA